MAGWTHVVTGGPWPERIGLRCRIVPPPAGWRGYPWHGLGKREVVVLIDGDPLTRPFMGIEHDPRWTCVLDRGDITEAA